MAKPDFAFQTKHHTWYPTAEAGVYRAVPGGATIALSLDTQRVPEGLLDRDLERAVAAWVIARGGRRLRLNGCEQAIAPGDLDRLPAGTVQRLVSIAPSNAEIVAAVGATALLVGVESSSDYPPEVETLPRLGPDLHVDMAALAALKPDLVLASLSVPGMERNIAALDRLGVPMLVLAPQTLADIRADVRRVGALLGRPETAGRVVADMEAGIAALAARRPPGPPVRVLLQWWPRPVFSPGRACWSNELIALAGGVNVFGDLPGQSAEVAPEQVVQADPEVIFLSWCGVPYTKLKPERVLRDPAIASVRAVRERRVVPVDEVLLGRPGPRVVQGVARMAEAIRAARPTPEAS